MVLSFIGLTYVFCGLNGCDVPVFFLIGRLQAPKWIFFGLFRTMFMEYKPYFLEIPFRNFSMNTAFFDDFVRCAQIGCKGFKLVYKNAIINSPKRRN